jgi:hypothetical protein
MKEMRNAYDILIRNPEGKRSLGRYRHRWEEGCGLDSSDSGQGPVMGPCEHGNEPLGSIKGRYFLTR